jgi:DNA-binding GntR family transcriptional regulator
MMPSYNTPSSNPHRQLRNLVADRLRAAILNGEIKPGEWLRQEKLAAEYHVSQMPIREALKELSAEGLVEHVPYRGVRVIEFSADDIEDLYASRSFLEGKAARAAAARITADELGELKKMLVQMREDLQNGAFTEYHDLNRHFHTLIINASRRTYLIRTLSQMWDAFPSMLWNNYSLTANRAMPSRDEADVADHEQLVEALERRDADTAESIAHHHIHDSGQYLVEVLRGQS